MIAAVGVQPFGDHRGQARFVAVEDVDEFQQRADSLGVGGAQWHLRQPLPTGACEPVRHRDQYAGFGEHRMDLGLQSGSGRDELGSVAHQLAQLARLGWGDPGLGLSTHPQQIGQIGGVAYIVFHSPVPEPFDSQRMRQMHPRSAGLQHLTAVASGMMCVTLAPLWPRSSTHW